MVDSTRFAPLDDEPGSAPRATHTLGHDPAMAFGCVRPEASALTRPQQHAYVHSTI